MVIIYAALKMQEVFLTKEFACVFSLECYISMPDFAYLANFQIIN